MKVSRKIDEMLFALVEVMLLMCVNTVCVKSAGIGGMSHLVNFSGTDTIAALMAARTYYQCPMAGFSVPAAEHRLVCGIQLMAT